MTHENSTAHRGKAALFSPYLSLRGGGERYILSLAKELDRNYDVTLFAPPDVFRTARDVFHISLSSISLQPERFFLEKNGLSRFLFLRQFRAVFFMTDGSLFFPPAEKNFLIIQSPLHIPKNSFINTMKKKKWVLVCYSPFMQQIVSDRMHLPSFILSPPVDTGAFGDLPQKKERIILSVGRFFLSPHSKKHEILIETFRRHSADVFRDWKLVICGGLSEASGRGVVEKLRHLSTGYPVSIEVNVPFQTIREYYRRASIYWHATGWNEDLAVHPERAEHFGISTVEAMASGAVPVVFHGGGQGDIVTDDLNGFLWETPDELVFKTKRVIGHTREWERISRNARKRAEDFSLSSFQRRIDILLSFSPRERIPS